MRVASLMALVAFAALAVPPMPVSANGVGSCGGLAPVVSYCSNGDVFYWNIFEWGFQFPDCVLDVPVRATPCFIGTLDSTLSGGGRTLTKRCHVVVFPPSQGQSEQDCIIFGETPGIALVRNDCYAYAYSDTDFEAPLPGGAGEWRCVFQ